jgi:hypothetical protein
MACVRVSEETYSKIRELSGIKNLSMKAVVDLACSNYVIKLFVDSLSDRASPKIKKETSPCSLGEDLFL